MFLRILESFEFDCASPALSEVLKIALSDDQSYIDVQILFHVIGEAVAKVRDRNVSFWITVMTITGSSISWVDFRRKLSKWLSTNGMNIGQIKNVITFVQQNVDPHSTGLVRKDTFLKFADDLMGHDCILSPGSFLSLAQEESSKAAPPITRPPVGESTHIKLPIPKVLAPRTPIPGTIVAHSSQIVASSLKQKAESPSLLAIRQKLAVGGLHKLVSSRMRILFALFRIASVEQTIPTRQEPKIATPRLHDKSAALAVGMAVQLVRKRLLLQAFDGVRYNVEDKEETVVQVPEQEQETTVVQAGADALLDNDCGPSWTVTIQAVAVSNLFGIIRTALCRASMPAYFSIKSGHSVDVFNPLKKVLWAQSSQGKRDSMAALGKQPRGVLAPINENLPSTNLVKANIPSRGIEFDLSV
jgi:hypothetical protein